MAISNAVSLANLSSADALTVNSTSDKVGIASTAPTTTLDVDGSITSGNINSSGIVTAVSFSGSGANLTGIDATSLKDSGGNVKVQANTSGAVVTGIITATTGSFTGNVTGVDGTFSGNVSIGGTLTYEDVDNIDSVGLVTARSGVIASGIGLSVSEGGIRVTGVVTATSFSGSGANLTNLNIPAGFTELDAALFN